VIKPAQDTPLSTLNLVRVLSDAGIPKGVINVVTGYGPESGAPLLEHPEVRAISFTGSSAVGRTIGTTAAKSFKHCSLELGGKNPMIVLDDANLDLAIEGGLWGAFGTTGQRCTATSRIILHKDIYAKFVKLFVERAKKIKVGNGLDESIEMGPAINEEQLKRDLSYIDIGKAEGAKLLTGGSRIEDGDLKHGYFVQPTVLVNTKPGMKAMEEEIWDRTFAVNLKGAFFCCRAVAPLMKKQGSGRIINIASVAGLTGQGSSIAYCASKAALICMTKSLARVLGPEVGVNAIAPGLIDTRWLEGGSDPNGMRDRYKNNSVLKRVGTPEDIAEVALMLASEARFMTGQVIAVDGGITL
jgi:hypothetical protein